MTQENQLWKYELEILDEIVRICDTNKLEYFLIYGSLLGAVRHKGFIPWDDDIDIGMLRKDYNRFIEICIKGDMNNSFYIQHQKNDKSYWLPYTKIRRNYTKFLLNNNNINSSHDGVFVDVFPFDNVPREKSIIGHLIVIIINRILWPLMYYKKLNDISNERLRVKIFVKLTNRVCLDKINNLIQSISSIMNSFKTDYIFNSYNYPFKAFSLNEFYPLNKKIFNGKLYYTPGNYDYVLKKCYGDYHKLPDLEDQKGHQ